MCRNLGGSLGSGLCLRGGLGRSGAEAQQAALAWDAALVLAFLGLTSQGLKFAEGTGGGRCRSLGRHVVARGAAAAGDRTRPYGCSGCQAGDDPQLHLAATAATDRLPRLLPPHLRRGTGEAIGGGRVRAGAAGSAAALCPTVFACIARRRLLGALGHAAASDGESPARLKEQNIHACNKRHIARARAPRAKVLRQVWAQRWAGEREDEGAHMAAAVPVVALATCSFRTAAVAPRASQRAPTLHCMTEL